jgi:putative transposase
VLGVVAVFQRARTEALEELAGLVGRVQACAALGVSRQTWYARNRKSPAPVRPRAPRRAHPSALTADERDRVHAELDSERFADMAPASVYATLLDEGVYLASQSTMYRILRERGEIRDRRRQRTHPPKTIPELKATAPLQVWTWDVTVLRGPDKREKYFLYSMIDVYSRYTVGWMVAPVESEVLSTQFLRETVTKHGNPPGLTIHSDRGAIQTARSVAVMLADLGVLKSHSRPKTSNDNPFSEAQFKTLKYRHDYPGRFASIHAARQWAQGFFHWYHHEHRHSGIAMHTPHNVHHGLADQVHTQRTTTLHTAYAAHPERFHRRPEPPTIPHTVWINNPALRQPVTAKIPATH